MTDPLFVADLDMLRARLRLTGVPATATDTLAILDESLLRTRLNLYRRLGEQRVNQLAAMSYVENPTSEDNILRALANSVEIKMVWLELMRRLPHAWMDASGDINKRWNEEAPFRQRAPSDYKQELDRLHNEIEEDIQMLARDDTLGDAPEIFAYDGTPEDTCPPRPGDTLRGFNRLSRRFSND